MEPGNFWGKKCESTWTKNLNSPPSHIKSSENLNIFKV